MSRQRTVVCAGYSPLDIVLHGSRTRHAAGGTAGNVAAILAFLGWNSSLVGEIGDDPAGSALLADLNRAGVATDNLVRATGGTARIVHRTSEQGHSYEFSCPTCQTRFPRGRKLSLARAEAVAASVPAPLVYFFDRANHGTIKLAELFSVSGSTIVFEPPFAPESPLAVRALEIVDILKFSVDIGIADIDSVPVARSGQVQVATSGKAGAAYRIGGRAWQRSPAFSYPAVDEAGAGDWTSAAFIHALASGQRTSAGVRDALVWAQAIAAVSCGSVGARGIAHVRSRDSVLRSARRLRRDHGVSATRRRRAPDELGLGRVIATGVCSTCLEPDSAASEGWHIRWQTPLASARPAAANE